jgi:pyrimidine deaminase RibD-like protein
MDSEAQQALDQVFMQRAFELAQQAEAINEIPVGAVVVANNQVISEGYNQSITLSFAKLPSARLYALCNIGALPNVRRFIGA